MSNIVNNKIAHLDLNKLCEQLATEFEVEAADVKAIIKENCEDQLGRSIGDSIAISFEQPQQAAGPLSVKTLASAAEAPIKWPTLAEIESIFAPPAKGGLKVADIKVYLSENGIVGVSKLTKQQLKDMLIAKAPKQAAAAAAVVAATTAPKPLPVVVDDTEESASASVTTEEVEAMFATPAKGGLKMAEIKEKAATLGIKGVMKKSDLKEAMLNVAIDAPIHIKQDDSASESETTNECSFVFTKGPRKGEKCTTKPKNGEPFCGKHKGCKSIDGSGTPPTAAETASEVADATVDTSTADAASTGEESESGVGKCIYVATRGMHKNVKCGAQVKPDPESKCSEYFCTKHSGTQQALQWGDAQDLKDATEPTDAVLACLYIGARGANKGLACGGKPKVGEAFCTKHINTAQAIQYKANDSPAARKAAQKAAESDSDSSKPPITRNKDLKLWVVDGGDLVVKSPKNPTVYAYITKSGEVKNQLPDTVRAMAEQLGLVVE